MEFSTTYTTFLKNSIFVFIASIVDNFSKIKIQFCNEFVAFYSTKVVANYAAIPNAIFGFLKFFVFEVIKKQKWKWFYYKEQPRFILFPN